MKTFWWYKDDEIAGMARPGFNGTPWFDFPYDEAILVGWIGQFSSGSTPLPDFYQHVKTYGAKVRNFYNLDERTAHDMLLPLFEKNGILNISQKIQNRASLLEDLEVTESELHFRFNRNRLESEIEFLKTQGIQHVISLTERHLDKDKLSEHFNTTHFSINDLGSPSIEQVEKLTEVLQSSKKYNNKVAVHCLAGIGRTSTMLMGAHILLGETLEHLKNHIGQKNPTYVFTGKQAEFLLSLEKNSAPKF